jgi:TonB-linked SusC/RagA family outer membrane protein
MLYALSASAQKVAVKGIIKDVNGNALAGITVTEVATANAVVTDEFGNFYIDVKQGSKIEVSGVGFVSYVLSSTDQNATIVLKASSNKLDDVAVIGYSSKKKQTLSSAVTVIKSEQLIDVTSNNLAALIQGKAPGVVVSTESGDPTSGSRVIIRGAGTINASTSPLYVVDGIIGGSFSPNDVESVTILRDAAATGLYGARAANGVIIVTTKTGKAGKAKIDFNIVNGIADPVMGRFQLMNSQQLYDYQQTFYNPDPSVLTHNTNWMDEALRRGFVQNYTLSASGGSEKTQYYLAGNYYKEEGTLVNNDKTAYTLRSNITTRITDKFKLSALINGIFTKDNYDPSGTLYNAYLNMPFDPVNNEDGTPVDPRFAPKWFGRDINNPFHSSQFNFSKARSFNLSADLNADYTILPNLVFSSYNRGLMFQFNSSDYYDRRTKQGAARNGESYSSNSLTSTLITSNRLRYSKDYGQHNFSGLVVAEVEKSYYDVQSSNVRVLPPGRPFFSTGIEVVTTPTGGLDEWMFSKYLGQLDYSYASKYFFTGSVVNEFSSRFGDNNPAATFYQLGGSWIMSKEGFMENVNQINFLKLRGSYGTTGNASGIGNFASLGLYTLNTDASYAGLPGAAPSQKANPDLTWEKSRQANIGLDVTFFKRFDLSIDVYDKLTYNLLFYKALPATTGFSGVYENVGSISNKGIEFHFVARIADKGPLRWESSLNMSFNRNKVLGLNEGRTEVNTGASQPIGLNRNMDDWFMPVWAGVDPANGSPLWEKLLIDSDGKSYVTYTNNYNLATRQYVGLSAMPKFTGGWMNTVSYKAFSLNAFMNFVYGNAVYNASRFLFDSDGLYESYNQMVLAEGWTRWEKPGDIATHPKPVFGRGDASNATSTRFLEDGSYLRLRNVTLSYNLPKQWLSRAKIQNARFFLSGDNLFTVTNFSGPDPEVTLGGTGDGNSSIKYPISRKIMFGINLTL